ncbi:hypothetical protein V8D89_006944 [Ganoderma adspersum]
MTACGAALIGYDYLLTVKREYQFFWQGKIGVPSLLFFVNRYLAVFYYLGLGMAYYRCQSFPVSLILEPGDCHAQEWYSVLHEYSSCTGCARQTSFLHSSLLNASYVTKLSEPITTVLISRFMLDLHQSNMETAHQGDSSFSATHFMSSLGGSRREPQSSSRASEGVELEAEDPEWSVSSVSSIDIELDEW